MVIQADKYVATVILDKVQAVLGDDKTYRKLPRDPCTKYPNRFIDMLKTTKKNGMLEKAAYRHLSFVLCILA